MSSLHYRIAPEVFAAHPGYVRGVLVFDGLDNTQPSPAAEQALRQAEQQARDAVTGPIAEWPPVAAWRQAYKSFGAKPSEHRSAIEALLRRVLKPDALPAINTLVDIGNATSVRFGLPAGVHPLDDNAPADGHAIALRAAREGDTFLETEAAPPQAVPAGEIVLAEGQRVLTRRWTWRQAADTRTHSHSRRVFVDVDGLPPISPERVREAMQSIEALVLAHCGGRLCASAVLSAAAPELLMRFD